MKERPVSNVRMSGVHDEHCARLGRDHAEIEQFVLGQLICLVGYPLQELGAISTCSASTY